MVLQNLWKEAGAVAVLFSTLEAIAGLSLNPKKCVLIPRWTYTAGRAFMDLLREELPGWANFQTDTKGKYLGVWLGPGAGTLSWVLPLKKYTAQCAYIASLKLGGDHNTSLPSIGLINSFICCANQPSARGSYGTGASISQASRPRARKLDTNRCST